MKYTIFIIFFISIPLIAVDSQNRTSSKTSETPKIDYESLAQRLINNANAYMKHHYSRLREHFLTLNRKFNLVNNLPLVTEITTNYRIFSNQLALNLSVIPLAEIKNDLLRRQVKILGKLQLAGLESEDYAKAMSLLNTMSSFGTSKYVCNYRTNDCDSHFAYIPHIRDAISRSPLAEELEHYWLSWREKINEDSLARDTFIEYVSYLQKAAAHNGHVTPSKTWYLYYEEDSLIDEFEQAIWDVMPLYKEMHAYMRNVLRNKYGANLIPEDSAIPQHLMEQVLQHAWKAKSIFSPPHPEKKLPDIRHKMDVADFTPLKINELASKFFESLNLHHFSANFWKQYARKLSDEEAGTDCKASVYYFPPDVGLRYCPKADFKKFLQMHGHMSELQYNLYKSTLPHGLDRDACPGFGTAIGEAAIVSAGSPRHLEKIDLIDNYTLDNELTMNRLFRLGVHTLISLPMYFVNEKFIVETIDSHIFPTELNCAYWKIQAKFAGVSPPNIRKENQFDPGYLLYKGLDPAKPNTVKLVSEILGYQIYRGLCIATKQYIPGNPQYPLNNCDFSDNEIAGQLLRDLMKLGSTKHWREAMQMITKEKKLNGKAIMEYYEPLYKWLQEENKRNGVQVGWDSSAKMCQG